MGRPYTPILHEVIDGGLTPQAQAVYLKLGKHADNLTGETWVSRETLAHHIKAKQARSVDRYITELVDADLVDVRPRWHAAGDVRDIVFERDSAHPVRATNLYTLKGWCVTAHDPSAVQRTTVVRQIAQELEPSNYNQRTKTTPAPNAVLEEAQARTAQRQAQPSRPLPGWVTDTHITDAEAKSLDLHAFVARTDREAKYSKPNYLSTLIQRASRVIAGGLVEE